MTKLKNKIMLLLLIAVTVLIAPSITTYATVVDSTSSNTSGSTGTDTTNSGGASDSKTAWLIYIVDSSGNTVSGTDAQVWKISGNNALPTNANFKSFIPSIGNASVTWTSYTADFDKPFYNASDTTHSNEPKIKEWMKETDSDDISNAWNFIKGLWGEDIAEDWIQEDYYLILEILVWNNIGYRATVPSGSTVFSGTPLVFGTFSYMAERTKAYLEQVKGSPYYYNNAYGSSSIYYNAYRHIHAFEMTIDIGDVLACPSSLRGSYLTYDQINKYGYGIMPISATSLGIEKEPEIEGDSYFYSLSSVGNSYPSGTSSTGGTSSSSSIIGASSTSGSDGINTSNTNPYALLKASFSAGSGATGTAPYALALSLKDNLSCSSYSNSAIPTGSTFSFEM